MNRKMASKRAPWAVVCALLVQGCSGGDGTGMAPDGPDPDGRIDPLYSDIQAEVFTPSCAVAGCHAGAGAPQGLSLEAASSYGLLVNVASSEVPSLLRVQPGNPDDSYLVRKLEGNAAAGARMPLGRPPLPQATIDVIRQWITEGATDDRASSLGDVRVMALSPVPGSTLGAAPAEIIVMFDRPLDASTVNANTLQLFASGGDGEFGNGNDVQLAGSITMSADGRRARLATGGQALEADSYRIRIAGSGPSFVMDLAANALDGEFHGTLPSGDGRQGGDFIAGFTIDDSITQDAPDGLSPTTAADGDLP
ncbi:MAG: Ig-like domain-containing protein [Woeseiaceae bacterium]|nr:Ig-like domain-containing protein [Woeseiaceae bacterium]